MISLSLITVSKTYTYFYYTGWKTIEENQIYTQNEYEEYEKRRLEELRYLQQRGLVSYKSMSKHLELTMPQDCP